MSVYLGIDIGFRNFSFCEVHLSSSTGNHIKQWRNIDLLSFIPHRHRVKDIHASDLFLLLTIIKTQLLPAKYIRTHVNHIGIETQPFKKNGNCLKLNLLAHHIYNYLIDIRSTITYGDSLYSVRFVSGKLKYCTKWLRLFEDGSVKKKRSYKQRKILSVRLCTALLSQYQFSTTIPVVHKQDDFADSFLIAMCLTL